MTVLAGNNLTQAEFIVYVVVGCLSLVCCGCLVFWIVRSFYSGVRALFALLCCCPRAVISCVKTFASGGTSNTNTATALPRK